MLRIHFTIEDLARTRFAVLGPLVEAAYGLRVLQQTRAADRFGAWQRRTAPRLTPRLRSLAPLWPARGRVLDLISLIGGAPSIEQSLERVHTVPPDVLQQEIQPILQEPPPSWIRDLVDGQPAARAHLLNALDEFHRLAIEPFWDGMKAALEADRARRAHDFLDGGLGRCLSGLGVPLQWRSPVLEIDGPTLGTIDVHLDGRGLLLVPSIFCSVPELLVPAQSSRTAAPSELVLVYPAARAVAETLMTAAPDGQHSQSLGLVLGRVRASVLESVADKPGITSGQLARELRISPASASEHATILRKAGLIASHRERNMVRHSVTAAGRALLNGGRRVCHF